MIKRYVLIVRETDTLCMNVVKEIVTRIKVFVSVIILICNYPQRNVNFTNNESLSRNNQDYKPRNIEQTVEHTETGILQTVHAAEINI